MAIDKDLFISSHKIFFRKPLSEWESIGDVCCLLFTLSASDLDQIKSEVLITCSCESMESSPSAEVDEVSILIGEFVH